MKTLLIPVAALLALTGPVFAAEPAPKDSVFAKVDDDRDERISVVEARKSTPLQAAFQKLDADRDGFLTQTEFSQWEEADNIAVVAPPDPALTPSGSRGAQHMPKRD